MTVDALSLSLNQPTNQPTNQPHVPPPLHPLAVRHPDLLVHPLFDQASSRSDVAVVCESADMVDVGVCRHIDCIVGGVECHAAAHGGWRYEDGRWTGQTRDPNDCQCEFGCD